MLSTTVYNGTADVPQAVLQQLEYPQQSDFLTSHNWFDCLADFGIEPDNRVRIYVVSNEQKQVLAALYCIHKTGSRYLHSLSSFYTTEFAPVGSSFEGRAEAFAVLARHLGQETPAWHGIECRLLRECNALQHPLFRELAATGFFSYQYPFYENWFVDTTATDFETYYSSLSSRVRNTIRRKGNKLKKEHDVRIELFRDDDEALTRGVADWTTIYNASWKDPEPFPDFMPQLARACAQSGTLLLGILYLDDQPVAAQFWIVTPERAVIYKLAYVEEFARKSPGSVLSKALFETALTEYSCKEIDYGVGSEPYKKDWMNDCRQLFNVQAYNRRTLAGIASIAVHRIKSALKALLGRNAAAK